MEVAKFKKIIAYLCDVTKGTDWEGHVYAVGGCMRDRQLGFIVIKDIDLVIDLPDGGLGFSQWLNEKGLLKGDPVVYPNYGTAAFNLKLFPKEQIECVQTRKEQYKDVNSRNPETTYGTIEEDAFRRDLTINAIYQRISDGAILDPTGLGIKDIKDHVIRTTTDPEIVFSDDPLRILRTIRFSARLGWEINPETVSGMCQMYERLSVISAERIRSEIGQILTGRNVKKALQFMVETGIMKYVIPEVYDIVGLEQNKYHDCDVWEHTLKVVDCLEKKGDKCEEVRMAALLHDIGKSETRTVDDKGGVHFIMHEFASARIAKEVLERLKYPNKFIKEVVFLIRSHMWGFPKGDMAVKRKVISKCQIACGNAEMWEKLASLIDADRNSHAPEHCDEGCYERLMGIHETTTADGTAMYGYKLPVTGEDVMRIKGIRQGPKVKEYLAYLMKIALSRPLITKEHLIRHLRGFKLKDG